MFNFESKCFLELQEILKMNFNCLGNVFIDTFSIDVYTLSNGIEGGTKWIVNKIKGLHFLSLSVAQIFIL